MIIEIFIGLIAFSVCFWFFLKIIEDIKIKKLRRRYNEEDDPGKKLTPEKEIGLGFRTTRSPVERKPILQDAIVDAKRELLSGGDIGIDNDTTKPIVKTRHNNRRKTKRPK